MVAEIMTRIWKPLYSYLWNSLGRLNDPHFLCCLLDMWFLDRFEWLIKAFRRASFKLLSFEINWSRKTKLSIFKLFPCLVYLLASSPFATISFTILFTVSFAFRTFIKIKKKKNTYMIEPKKKTLFYNNAKSKIGILLNYTILEEIPLDH